MFKNRIEAGNLLGDKLITYSNQKDTIIVTIPRGGVPVGYAISKKLNLPLEIVLSKKIGHPFNKEYAIGSVTLKNRILGAEVPGISKSYIDEQTNQIRKVLKQRKAIYYGSKTPLNLKGKTIIIVDDGVATGNTLISSIQLIQLQKPFKIIVALPVAPLDTLRKIKKLPEVNNVLCLLTPSHFRSVGEFYVDFKQIPDEDVIMLLKKANSNYLLNI